MLICPSCGQPIDEDRDKCPMCNSPVNTEEPDIQETEEMESRESQDASVEHQERPFVKVLKKLVKSKQFWMVSAYVLAGLLTIFWGGRIIGKIFTHKKEVVQTVQVEPGLKQQFETMIDEILPEKLEWGREVLKYRLPSRFPDELVLDTNKAAAEVEYENSERNAAYYEFEVCYHFEDDIEETYHWAPVTFYFELRDGQWMMIGDKWMRDTELSLE